MNAKLDIKVGVHVKKKQLDEPFTPTISYTSSWHWTSDLNSYSSLLSSIATEVYAFVVDHRQIRGVTDATTHVAIRLDNPTHPTAASGVVPLAKGHRDCALSDGNFTSAQDLLDLMTGVVVNLKDTARY